MYSFADFEQIGIDNPAQPSPPKAQDPACIMYTSGTTGTCFDACHPLDSNKFVVQKLLHKSTSHVANLTKIKLTQPCNMSLESTTLF